MTSNPKKMPTFGHLTNLSAEKLQDLDTVLTAILALPIARDTFAQLIVGDKTKPSDHALEEYQKIRTGFAPQSLKLDLKLAQAYQDATPGSLEQLLRLLEIAAASLHTLAGNVYVTYHKDLDIRPPKPPEGHAYQFDLTDHFYVDFYHTNYKRFDDYPLGLMDVVGYWAETELLGGVALFEREKSGLAITNAFLHPQKVCRAFQLSETQLRSFAALGRVGSTAKSVDAKTVLPFAKEVDARNEPTFVLWGEPPLRIYKNEYDQPTVAFPNRPRCLIKKGEPGFASMDETMRIVKEKGLFKDLVEKHKAASTPKGEPHATDDNNL